MANDSPSLSAQAVTRHRRRIIPSDVADDGRGFGLSIVRIITKLSGADYNLTSRRQEQTAVEEACFYFSGSGVDHTTTSIFPDSVSAWTAAGRGPIIYNM